MHLADTTDTALLRIAITPIELDRLYRIVMTANLTAADMDPTPYDFTQEDAAESADQLERLAQSLEGAERNKAGRDDVPQAGPSLVIELTLPEFGRIYGIVMTMDISFDPANNGNPLDVLPEEVREMAETFTTLSRQSQKARKVAS